MISINLVAIAETVKLEPFQGPKEMVILLLLFVIQAFTKVRFCMLQSASTYAVLSRRQVRPI